MLSRIETFNAHCHPECRLGGMKDLVKQNENLKRISHPLWGGWQHVLVRIRPFCAYIVAPTLLGKIPQENKKGRASKHDLL